MYKRRSLLSLLKQEKLLEHFVAETIAKAAAEPIGVHRNTAATFYTRLRKMIALEMERAAPVFGEIATDVNYFGSERKGKYGRSAADKVPVFSLLKRDGRAHTVMISNARNTMLTSLIQRMILPDSIVCSDSFASYDERDTLVFHHVRINHSERFASDATTSTGSRISGIRLNGTCGTSMVEITGTSLIS